MGIENVFSSCFCCCQFGVWLFSVVLCCIGASVFSMSYLYDYYITAHDVSMI